VRYAWKGPCFRVWRVPSDDCAPEARSSSFLLVFPLSFSSRSATYRFTAPPRRLPSVLSLNGAPRPLSRLNPARARACARCPFPLAPGAAPRFPDPSLIRCLFHRPFANVTFPGLSRCKLRKYPIEERFPTPKQPVFGSPPTFLRSRTTLHRANPHFFRAAYWKLV